jgi:hypothetical protein
MPEPLRTLRFVAGVLSREVADTLTRIARRGAPADTGAPPIDTTTREVTDHAHPTQ